MSDSYPEAVGRLEQANAWLIEEFGRDYAGLGQIGTQLLGTESEFSNGLETVKGFDESRLEFLASSLWHYAHEDSPGFDFFPGDMTPQERQRAMIALGETANYVRDGNLEPDQYVLVENTNQLVDTVAIKNKVEELNTSSDVSAKLVIAAQLGGLIAAFNTNHSHSLHRMARARIKDATDAIELTRSQHEWHERLSAITPVDADRFDELRLKFGAKAANLMLLQERLDQINHLWADNENPMVIPPFVTVPAQSYRTWKLTGQFDHATLKTYYEQLQAMCPQREVEDTYPREEDFDDYLDYLDAAAVHGFYEPPAAPTFMVRSSAVHSEDGEMTGAGIYSTSKVSETAGFDAFCNAVENVYKSVDSKEAQAYREAHGVTDEAMGLVLQLRYELEGYNGMAFGKPYTSFNNHGYFGTLDTTTIGMPNSMRHQINDIVVHLRRQVISDNVSLLWPKQRDQHGNGSIEIYHMPPDPHLVHTGYLQSIASFGIVAEQLWGGPVQIEYQNAPDGAIAIVQVRKLPARYRENTPNTIAFPDGEPLFRSPGMGTIDAELPVLSAWDDNSDRRGVVIIPEEHNSAQRGLHPRYLPKEGALISLNPSGNSGLHQGTIALEAGLAVMARGNGFSGNEGNWPHLYRLGKQPDSSVVLRLVVNGEEGRVYVVDQPTAPSDEQ